VHVLVHLDTVDVFTIVDEMKERGWYIQPQLTFETSRKNIHISINESNAGLVDGLLRDLEDSVTAAKAVKASGLASEVERLLAAQGSQEISDQDISGMMAMLGIQGNRLPSRMAEINGILDVLPVRLRERLLINFLNDLFVQPDDADPERRQ